MYKLHITFSILLFLVLDTQLEFPSFICFGVIRHLLSMLNNRKICIFGSPRCFQFRFWSPFKIVNEFCPLILSNHSILVLESRIGRWLLQRDVDCHVSRSYWMMTVTCHIVIICLILYCLSNFGGKNQLYNLLVWEGKKQRMVNLKICWI